MNSLFLDWERRTKQMECSHDADQTEWQAVRFSTANISEGLRDEVLASELTVGSQIAEEEEGLLTEEIQRRIDLFGESYPFKRNGSALTHVPSKTGVYEFCLAISFLNSISSREGQPFQIAFERLIRDVLCAFLGPGASSYRVGIPGDQLEDRPARIPQMAKEVCELIGTGEFGWCPASELPEDPVRRSAGDLGMDVIAWKQFPDKRRGNLCIIGQCACGKTDWDSKLGEPSQKRLESWFRPLTFTPYLKCFAVPFHIPNVIHFGMVNETAGLTLDRGRIALVCEASTNEQYITSKARIRYRDLLQRAIDAQSD